MGEYRYTVYGSPSCTQCKVCKKLFNQKGIEYLYIDITEITDVGANSILEYARASGLGNLPIVIDNETGNVVRWQEVLRNA